MENYTLFYESIKKAAERFKGWDKSKSIHIISHLDADGISSCAILVQLMNSENRRYSLSIVPQLDEDEIRKISKYESDYIIFSDLGSGTLSKIKEIIKNKEIIILDHHNVEEAQIPKSMSHINPHLNDIDGSTEISGAGVCFLFASEIDDKYESLAHIAILGAIGDIQEKNGFEKLNEDILKKAIKNNKISTKKTLKFFGRNTRPIHKVLEYSSEPKIPNVSGSESGAIQFLHEIGIKPKNKNKWRTISDLDEEEVKKLITGIVIRRNGEIKPQDVIGFCYNFLEHDKNSPMGDAREFATLLNACGRMNRASLGIGACLNQKEDKRKALNTLAEYKKEIVGAIEWFKKKCDKKDCKEIIKGKDYIIINAGTQVRATVIGTLASIVSKSNLIPDNNYIISMARNDDNKTKISMRIKSDNEEIDLRDIVKSIIEKSGGEAGGHMRAAGAIISTKDEDTFIKEAISILKDTKNLYQSE